MAWFKVDDAFHAHHKVTKLEDGPCRNEALSLWLIAGSWCAKMLTGGHIHRRWIKRLGYRIRAAEELSRVGLWERTEDGYRFKDWAEYQPSADEVITKRRQNADRQKKFRRTHDREQSNALPNASRNAARDALVTHPPIPIPIQETEEPSEGEGAIADCRGGAAGANYTPPPLTEWSPERQSTAFRKAYLARRQTDPSMGGRNVADFHRRVVETAAARGVDPAQLFAEALKRWLDRPLNERERSAPYACFANAFGDLVDREGQSGVSAEVEEMQREMTEVWRVVRGGKRNAN